jgi:uncharacterized LabA/DUF88 family protein
MKKLIFLVDGFNLYHSILRLERDTGYCTKWLDIKSLCQSYIYLFGKDAELRSIYYFSAIPHYLRPRNPKKIRRHKTYMSCLKSSGIEVVLGRFKQKDVYCDKCRNMILKHEEKETDVSIAITLMEIFLKDLCDSAVIVSGDTDLSPAIRKCQSLFKNKKVTFAFPYKRKNKELLSLAPGSFSINKKQYIRHQFPNPVVLKDGCKIFKPKSW